MGMTHEQKPEGAEFRTREAHRQQIAQAWQDEGMSCSLADAWADRELSEAEARGAAEQRRKDAEGAEPVGRVTGHWADGTPMFDGWDTARPLALGAFVYDRPANVAVLEKALNDIGNEVLEGAEPFLDAVIRILKTVGIDPLNGSEPMDQVADLEDRVKELEGEIERLSKPEFYSVEDQETGWFDLESLMVSIDGDIPHFEPVEIDCFRSVPKIWAFSDGSKIHEFATENEARAASAAAIREGGEHG